MKRADLEHILRASKDVTGESEFIVIGSQSILGPHPDAPRALRESMEADLYPRFQPNLADLIEGSLGRYSQFDQTFGYFADGVSPATAVLPEGWESRLIPVCNENTGGATGWCLEPHDLAFSKLAARRAKDLKFVATLIRHKFVRPSRLIQLIATAADTSLRQRLTEALAACRQR
jgi:uncharacterized nucleotidyltransferase DUF6036